MMNLNNPFKNDVWEQIHLRIIDGNNPFKDYGRKQPL